MSRSKPRMGSKSPIQKYIDFGGGEGNFTYYDKNKEETVQVELKNVIVLDVRNSISGYSQKDSATIGSNLVSNINSEEITVVLYGKGKTTTFVKGLYKDIKKDVKDIGGKFTTNVIALADVGNGQEMVNIRLAGVGNSSWIGFTSENADYYDYALNFSRGVLSKIDKDNKVVPVTAKEEDELDAKLKKNPRAPRPVWFYVIDIEKGNALTDDEIEMATEQDEKLQAYFDGLSTTTSSPRGESSPEPDAPEDPEEEGKGKLPF